MNTYTKRKILLIEDEAIIANSHFAFLTMNGYDVIISESGEEAISVFKKDIDESINLVLSDIDLGDGIDGTDAAKEILKIRNIPVVFLTSHFEKEYIDRIKKITRYGFIDKNSGNFVLLSSLEMAFELFQSYKRTAYHAYLLDNVSDAVISTDTNFIITSWNKGAEALYGFKSEEVIGKSINTVIVTESMDSSKVIFSKELVEKGNWEGEVIQYTKERKLIYIHSSLKMLATHGYPDTAIAVNRNITERKKAQIELYENEKNLSITLQSIGDAVIATNKEGNIIRMNTMAEQLTGWLLKDAVNKKLTDVFHVLNTSTREILKNPVELVMQKGEIIALSNHTILVSKDGKEYQISDSAAPIKDEFGNISGVVLVFSDVTKEYEAREKIKENEEKFSKAFHSQTVGMCINDSAGGIFEINDAAAKILGYSKEEIIGKTGKELNLYSDLGVLNDIRRRIRENKQINNIEVKLKSKSGKIRICLASIETITIEGREYWLTALNDITDYKQAQKSLEISEFMLENFTDQVYWIDKNGKILSVNAAAIRVLGYTKEKLLTMTIGDITVNYDLKTWDTHWSELKEKKSIKFDSNQITKDGKQLEVEITDHYVEFEGIEYNCIFIKDISQRKKTEQEILQLQSQAVSILESIGDGFVSMDEKLKITYFNKSAENMMGKSKKNVIGKYYLDSFPEFEDSIFEINFNRALKEKVLITIDTFFEPYNNWYELRIYPQEKGISIYFIVTSERKKTEKALRESEERYKVIVESSPETICVHRGGKIIYVNSAGFKLFGVNFPNQIIGKPILSFVHPDYHELVLKRVSKMQKEKIEVPAIEEKFIKLDGTVIDVEISGKQIIFDGKPAIQNIITNITERKKIESLLSQKDILLREVHHRIKNNMLSVASFLSLQANQDTNARGALIDASSRINTMMAIYESLYRSGDFKNISVKSHLSNLIDEIVSAFSTNDSIKIKKDIEDFELDSQIMFPIGIIMNELLINSLKYAFPNNSIGEIQITIFKAEKSVELIISDNGIGISETLDIKKSPGFGLQLVTMLTKKSKNNLELIRGNGTTYKITIGI